MLEHTHEVNKYTMSDTKKKNSIIRPSKTYLLELPKIKYKTKER